MKFMVILTETDHYDRWAALTDEARAEMFAAFERYDAAVAERGTVLGGEGLAHPKTARTLGPGPADSRPITEGPYAETAEQIGGFYLVDLPDLESAIDTARVLPEEFSIEIRPVVDA